MNKDKEYSDRLKWLLRTNIIIIILFLILTAFTAKIVFFPSDSDPSSQKPSLKKEKKIANAYLNNELYKKAISKYRHIIDNHPLSDNRKANILYIIGNTYREELKDYENALATYLELRNLYPNSNLIKDVNKKIVACLDYVGRTTQAKQELDKTTTINAEQQHPTGGEILAKIGEREITEREFNSALNKLPESRARKYKGEIGRYKFLQQYITNELLYQKAKRRGYDEEPDIIKKVKDYKKQIMAQKVFQNQLGKEANISESTLKSFYRKNRKRFRGKTFNQVKPQIYKELLGKKLEVLQRQFLQDMMSKEKVEMYPESLGISQRKLRKMRSRNSARQGSTEIGEIQGNE